jgi:inositol oxygenase
MTKYTIYTLLFGFIFYINYTDATTMVASDKQELEFRDYEDSAPDSVRDFYRTNHQYQTYNFVEDKIIQFGCLNHCTMSIWDAMRALDSIIDESDPDLQAAQSLHAFQTAQALRRDGHPRWLILTGLIHDLGKVLILFGEPQWAVVGDTFPVGCAYSAKIVYPQFFTDNPDMRNELFQTLYGMYEPQCGLENVRMSWGHDEYLYQVVKDYLPAQASYVIRYHSFYAAHKEGAYEHLMNDFDKQMMPLVHLFSTYDLYSKGSYELNIDELLPYYQELVAEFFPPLLRW